MRFKKGKQQNACLEELVAKTIARLTYAAAGLDEELEPYLKEVRA
jgi:hypothetical protein